MLHRFVIAIGAGCAAALLFAVSSQTSPLAMALAYLAPLPIMIVSLGWGLDGGGLAGAVSVLALGLLAGLPTGLLFAASIAAPAWVLAAFSATPIARYFSRRPPGALPYPSVGAIVALASFIGMALALAALVAVIVFYGGYAEGAKQITAALTAIARAAFEDEREAALAAEFANSLVLLAPAAIAASTLVMLCVNLYAAARSTQMSNGLARPWPDVPTSLHLPWPFAIALLACAACAYALPAPASQYALIVVGGLGGAFVLQGLAVAHALSRGLKLRTVMLIALYACCLLRAKYTIPVVAALGVADAFARLRSRAGFLPTAKPTTHK
ncbi:MAG TPA: DUF2232 domain-containing protein [Roseiarcus sp.]|nr:DUF2232 domain-containing protein [Roseiarcus sp.]